MRMDLMDAVEEMGHTSLVFEGLLRVAKYTGKDEMDILEYLETCKALSNGRPTTRAGQWRPSKREVEVHAKLLEPGREEELASTFLHEVAHAITDFSFPVLFGRDKPHGRNWQFVMRCLKQPPDVTADYDFLKDESTANYVYGCVCGCETEIYKQRKKKHHPKFTFIKKCKAQGRKSQLYLKRDNRRGIDYPNPGYQPITREERQIRANNTRRRRQYW